jgi:hypothetical protein
MKATMHFYNPTSTTVSSRPQISWGKRMRQLGETILHWMTDSSEPRIWVHRDRHGTELWEIYDPRSQRRAILLSEEDVREWLDNRYYSQVSV